jgi:N-6 DNA Methylase
MPLDWKEIANRARSFSKEWKHVESEDADAKSFWDEFFDVFGIKRRKVATFEQRVKKLNDKDGYIDLLWKGTLLIEHKSRGKDLDKAFAQAKDYFPGLKPEEEPRYILLCDFWHFKLHDLEEGTVHSFTLAELDKNLRLFYFIAGYRKQRIREEEAINREAVDALGALHDALKRDGYAGHDLEVFLVRLLFCLFADDTGIFQPKDIFHDLIEFHTTQDGSNVGAVLDTLFVTLNKDTPLRQVSLAEQFSVFPYVNGKLFEQRIDPPAFTAAMRIQLLNLAKRNWGNISPAIFGAMFQRVIELEEKDRRRELGAHYTSETNILKLIQPLFLDELRAEFEKIKGNTNKLFEFHKTLQSLTFLDPACGCGNFLVVAYRELRKLELDVLRAASRFGVQVGHVFDFLKVDVDQFYGIEIEEFPAQVAQVAMWLTDHQMNVEAGTEFGEPMLRVPLKRSAEIRHGNALRIDWADFVPPTKLNYILGNPPFRGKHLLNDQQSEDMDTVCHGIKNAKSLDFVSGWYIKAARYITTAPDSFAGIAAAASKDRKKFKDVKFGSEQAGFGDLFADIDRAETVARRKVRCGFVSTNSISQGEQAGVLWGWMFNQGMHIQFAHRTFKWTNDAPGKAAVHCIIVGFGTEKPKQALLADYPQIDAAPVIATVKSISPYLVEGGEFVVGSRSSPISSVPEAMYGSKPADGGHLILSNEEKETLLAAEPGAKPFVKPLISDKEFLHGKKRWCLWLKDVKTVELKNLPLVRSRLDEVRKFRLESTKPQTRQLADFPGSFAEIRQPATTYIVIPRHSSELRSYIPLGFCEPTEILSDSCTSVPNASLYHFGVLMSAMHMAWVKTVCGRIKSDYRYSNNIVYNNFPWPELNEKSDSSKADRLRTAIESAAQAVLDARAAELGATLADLYNSPMPEKLLKAHRTLDAAVDAAYGKRSFKSDAERVAFLFERYQALTSLL